MYSERAVPGRRIGEANLQTLAAGLRGLWWAVVAEVGDAQVPPSPGQTVATSFGDRMADSSADRALPVQRMKARASAGTSDNPVCMATPLTANNPLHIELHEWLTLARDLVAALFGPPRLSVRPARRSSPPCAERSI